MYIPAHFKIKDETLAFKYRCATDFNINEGKLKKITLKVTALTDSSLNKPN